MMASSSSNGGDDILNLSDVRAQRYRNVITAMANRIIPLDIASNIFDLKTYTTSFYLEKKFASSLRLLSQYTDDRKLERVLLLGIELNFFTSVSDCQPSEFYKFLNHLRTPAGQGKLQTIAYMERLEKRAAARGITVEEMAKIALAEVETSHLWKPRNETRKRLYEDIIADHQKRLKIDQEAVAASDCDEK